MSLSVFGQTPMSANIADMSDITKIVKIVGQIPSGDDALDGDVVQLEESQTGYNVGSFYKCSKAAGEEAVWSDVTEQILSGVPTGTDAECYLDLEDGKSCIMFSWKNPVDTALYALDHNEIILSNHQAESSEGETVLLSECTSGTTRSYTITLMITEAQFGEDACVFILRSYFKNGTHADTIFEKEV